MPSYLSPPAADAALARTEQQLDAEKRPARKVRTFVRRGHTVEIAPIGDLWRVRVDAHNAGSYLTFGRALGAAGEETQRLEGVARAKSLGRTVEAARPRSPRRPGPDGAVVVALRAGGLPWTAIGERLSCSEGAARGAYKRFIITRRRTSDGTVLV